MRATNPSLQTEKKHCNYLTPLPSLKIFSKRSPRGYRVLIPDFHELSCWWEDLYEYRLTFTDIPRLLLIHMWCVLWFLCPDNKVLTFKSAAPTCIKCLESNVEWFVCRAPSTFSAALRVYFSCTANFSNGGLTIAQHRTQCNWARTSMDEVIMNAR